MVCHFVCECLCVRDLLVDYCVVLCGVVCACVFDWFGAWPLTGHVLFVTFCVMFHGLMLCVMCCVGVCSVMLYLFEGVLACKCL